MRDFDTVLERLLTEPDFQRALAADPANALTGYDLSADERDLLHTQVVGDVGDDRTVETRTNKSGVVGLLGPVAAAFGMAATSAQTAALPGTHTFGTAPLAHEPLVSESVGDASGAHSEVLGAASPTESFGHAPAGPGEGSATFGEAPVQATGYHTRVDVNGDGTWDKHVDYERADGGVDITADMNHDGVVDFVGHDIDRDGRVDSADYDHNFDGVMDVRQYDDTGDGWLDRSEKLPHPSSP